MYKALAHPELNGYVTPFTLEERLLHVKEARRTLGTEFTWICDTMTNDVKHALGNAPNSEFVIDPGGRVVRKRVWSRPAELREDLEELVGRVENPTLASEVELPSEPPPEGVKTGVVPRVEMPGRTTPLRVEPVFEEKGLPFYVKLRAEADRNVLDGDPGKMYLGFHLDPLYRVHWNNLVAPLGYEIDLPEGVSVTPRTGSGPKLEEPADSDPREFIVDVDPGESDEPIRLTVRYFACDDAQTFCVPVTQKYSIRFDADPDGGSARRGGGGGGLAGRSRGDRGDGRPGGGRARREGAGRGFAGPGGPGGPARFIERLRESDADGDGRISRAEAPERMRGRFDFMDENGDGFLEMAEIEAVASRLGGARARERPLRDERAESPPAARPDAERPAETSTTSSEERSEVARVTSEPEREERGETPERRRRGGPPPITSPEVGSDGMVPTPRAEASGGEARQR